MSARDDILSAVRKARPSGVPLPDLGALAAAARSGHGDLVAEFTQAAQAGGASVIAAPRARIRSIVDEAALSRGRAISVLDASARPDADPHSYADVDLFVCEGTLGVAESGAIWVPESRFGIRSAFFLASDVWIVLPRAAIVPTLHDAYGAIDVAREAFGAFVAGPSKTADIEQALVVGAHGPKSLTVLLSED